MPLGDELLCKVAPQLVKLRWKTVFLGGSTTHLHLTDPTAPQPELTDDVDVVVEIHSPVEFQVELREDGPPPYSPASTPSFPTVKRAAQILK